jgi:squalene-hopene/tetraprenyl-beta-curcumene cyclase
MTNLALAGLVDWREVAPLPFELACVPQSLYRFVGMPVVSYAIPALVAIGQARYFHKRPRNPVTRLIRRLSIRRSLKVLRRMQPESGGYLEATPLTSFVVMSLAGGAVSSSEFHVSSSESGDVIREGIKFLVDSVRPDGSWPIDTNLATWNTTLAINALAGAGENVAELLGPKCLDWLLSCQHTKRHPFTGAKSGGFGWSDLSGAVPDADDTSGALLALDAVFSELEVTSNDRRRVDRAADHALGWLYELRNHDGGWPTFCRGWGKLPFDRSGSDLTAHVLRAFGAWEEFFADHEEDDFAEAPAKHKKVRRVGTRFLRLSQKPDGAWSPLWFGNQDRRDEDNPVYGTAKVLMAYRDLGLMDSDEARRGAAWLVANQNADGGWGSGVWQMRKAECGVRNGGSHGTAKLQSSVEETALAVEALLAAVPLNPEPRTLNPIAAAVVERGLNWLIERVERGEHRQPAPIGFYFAKLWYYEKLYPLTFTVAALGRAHRIYSRLTETGTEHQSQALRSQ